MVKKMAVRCIQRSFLAFRGILEKFLFEEMCLELKNAYKTMYEESSEFKVAVFYLNVPWAQHAETKSLIAGYQNQTLLFKYIINLA